MNQGTSLVGASSVSLSSLVDISQDVPRSPNGVSSSGAFMPDLAQWPLCKGPKAVDELPGASFASLTLFGSVTAAFHVPSSWLPW